MDDSSKRLFVLDANVLMHDPMSLFQIHAISDLESFITLDILDNKKVRCVFYYESELSPKAYLELKTCIKDFEPISWARLLEVTGRLGQAPPRPSNMLKNSVLSFL